MDPKTLACTNCQAVTTNDGKTVWVCENCGNENEPLTPDAAAAQAAIADAAASAGAPIAPPATQPAPQTPLPSASSPKTDTPV